MESDRSCCSRFRWCGIPVGVGCLIFSIFNMIIVSISLVACFTYIGYLVDIAVNPRRHTSMDGIGLVLNQLLCLILSIFFGIAFIHAVMLCYGAHKKKPGFVMAYFVYGIMVEFIVVSGGITLFLMEAIYYPHVIILAFCVVGYSFILTELYRDRRKEFVHLYENRACNILRRHFDVTRVF